MMRRVRRAFAFLSGVGSGILRPRRFSYAVVFVTDLCNAQCPYCFNTRLGHLSDHVPADKNGTRLSLEEYGRIAGHLRPLFQTVFGGGEPFLREDLDALAETFYRQAGTRLFSIPTNGALTGTVLGKTEEMLRRCPDATFNIQVSLDAVGERHDRLRALRDGFQKALETCEGLFRLRGRYGNVNVIVNTVLTRDNMREVSLLQDFLRERMGSRPWFHNLQYEQRPEAPDFARQEAAGRLPALFGLNPEGASWTRSLVARWYVGFVNALILYQLSQGRMVYRCNAGRKTLVMMPDGALSACEPFFFDPRYGRFPRLNVRDFGYDPYRLREAAVFQEMLGFIGRRQCAACPWSCAAITSMTYSPSNWPLFLTTPPLARTLEKMRS